jgi:hypothetical protein
MDRQQKVKTELNRPTFSNLMMNENCHFIPAESLEKLLVKIKEFEGYISPEIINTIAVDLTD